MQFDINRNKPTPKAVSKCPACQSELVAKCGKVMIWHWAHKSLDECDANWEPTTQWHLDWQAMVPESMQEVHMGKHIADVKLSNGKVIEIQHSNIPVEVVQDREQFYINMTWIFDGKDFFNRLNIKEKYFNGTLSHGFRFSRPRHYILEVKKFPFYIDFHEEGVFRVKGIKVYTSTSSFTGEEYKSYYFYGLLLERDAQLFKEIFGSYYVA